MIWDLILLDFNKTILVKYEHLIIVHAHPFDLIRHYCTLTETPCPTVTKRKSSNHIKILSFDGLFKNGHWMCTSTAQCDHVNFQVQSSYWQIIQILLLSRSNVLTSMFWMLKWSVKSSRPRDSPHTFSPSVQAPENHHLDYFPTYK